MPFSHLEIVEVVGGGDLDDAGAELHVHVIIGNDGNPPVQEGQDDVFAHQTGVPFVCRIDRNCRIPQHRLGPGGSNDQVAVAPLHGIPEMPQVSRFILVFHLDIGESRVTAWTPVDEPVVAVDQPLLEERDENLAHGEGETLIHGEAFPLPVAGTAEALQLADDLAARFRLPFPDTVDKGFPAKVVAILPLRSQLPLHHILGGDSRVVGAGHPEDVAAAHSLPAAEDILQGIVERMPHVQRPGYVRRGNHDAVCLRARLRLGMKVAMLLPFPVPLLFHSLRFVHFCQFFIGHALPS